MCESTSALWKPTTSDEFEPSHAALAIELELTSADGVFDVLTTVARLGLQLDSLHVEQKRLNCRVIGRGRVASRLTSLLRQRIHVRWVNELGPLESMPCPLSNESERVST